MADRKQKIETELKKVAGFDVEVTVRGDRDFTLSADGKRDWSKVIAYFGMAAVKVATEYDEECDFSLMYFSV